MNLEAYEILDWLIAHSSYECPLSAEMISERFSEGKFSDSVISEKLKELTNKPQLLEVMLREKEGKYYAELPFSEADIVILKATLLGIPYYEDFHQNEVVERLNAFIPEYMRETDSIKPHTNRYNGSFYSNVAEIIKALYPADYETTHSVKMISFNYCVYDSNKELVAKTKSNGKQEYRVNPLKIVCINNLFYLVTFYIKNGEIKYLTYRIDKMKNVKCSNELAERYSDYITSEEKHYLELKNQIALEKEQARIAGKIYEGSGADVAAEDCAKHIDRNGFNLGEYIHRNPTMYNDEEKIEMVKMNTTKYCIGRIIDTFGFEADITDFSDDIVSVTLHNPSIAVVKQFALQYFSEVEVVEPASMREKLKEAVSELGKKYEV